MKTLYSILILAGVFLSSNAIAMPPEITTKILEIQNFDGIYFFRIENPDLVNPAGCTETEFMRVGTIRSDDAGAQSIIDRLIKARDNDSTIGVFIRETQCLNQGRFPIIRGLRF